MKRTIAALLATGAVLCAGPAAAGLYRCGNNFQDKPCEDPAAQQAYKPGRTSGAGAALAPNAPAAAPCGRLRIRKEGVAQRLHNAEPSVVPMLQRQLQDAEKALVDAHCT